MRICPQDKDRDLSLKAILNPHLVTPVVTPGCEDVFSRVSLPVMVPDVLSHKQEVRHGKDR